MCGVSLASDGGVAPLASKVCSCTNITLLNRRGLVIRHRSLDVKSRVCSVSLTSGGGVTRLAARGGRVCSRLAVNGIRNH